MTGSPQSRPSRRIRRKLEAADYVALGAFRYALRRFLAFSEAGAVSQGLTSQQHQALLAVKAHQGPEAMSVGELAERLLIKNHSALGLVARLVERNMLVRDPSPIDRRRVVLRLTEGAHEVLEVISRNNLGELKSSAPVFAELLNALERLEAPAPEASARAQADKSHPPKS